MNDKLKKLTLNRKVESGSIGNTMHVVLLLCNGACNVNKGCIYKEKEFHKSTLSIFPLSIGHLQLNYYPCLFK